MRTELPNPKTMSQAPELLQRWAGPRLPFPRGWYALAESDDVPRREVRCVSAFGKDLVVFRTEDGKPHVTSAYCPHLGAHLGVGGTVVGDRIRCPFHGWEYGASTGACLRTGNGDPVPPRAKIQRWEVCERDGVIFVWHHDAGAAPSFAVDRCSAFDDEWSPWHKDTWEFSARIQDVGENEADVCHVNSLHGFADDLPEVEVSVDGPKCVTQLKFRANRDFYVGSRLARVLGLLRVPESFQVHAVVERVGFSLGYIRQQTLLSRGLRLRAQSLVTTTPIDEERVRVVARHRVEPLPTRWLTRLAVHRFAAAFAETLEEDIAIWEAKVYRARPMATKRDWAILEFRKWARQFYADGVYEAAWAQEATLRSAGALP